MEQETSTEVPLQYRCSQRILWIDHVAETNSPCLGEEEISFVFVPPIVLDQPMDKLAIGNPRCILHGPCGSDGHYEPFVLKPWPSDPPIFDKIDLDSSCGCYLDRHTTQLAI